MGAGELGEWRWTGPARAADAGALGGRFLFAGLRESIEVATDLQMVPLLDAIGDDLDELVALLEPWAVTIVTAGGFPSAITQIPASWGRLT